MPKFKIRGESTVEWELVIQGDLDHAEANMVAIEYVQDMLQLDHGQTVAGPFNVPECRIVGQTDRIFRNTEVPDHECESIVTANGHGAYCKTCGETTE